MELSYRPDWEKLKPRFEAWWAGEVLDRAAISVTAPRRQVALPEPRDDTARYADAQYLAEYYDRAYSATYFGGEALPMPLVMLGYAAWGGPVQFAPDTVWVYPSLGPEDDLTGFRFDWSHRWWVELQSLMRSLARAAHGKYFLGTAALVPPWDAISFYLGPEQLCFDLVERPEQLRVLHGHLMDVFKEMLTSQWQACGAAEVGYAGWLPDVWSATPYMTLQVDFSCLISKATFDAYVAPEVQGLASWLDRSIYHLDGPGALHHLDTLLEISELTGIQWEPGEGQLETLQRIPMLRRIQAAGKNLHISVRPNEVEQALEELRPEGLFIRTECESEAEAKELLKKAELWTRSRK